MMAKKTIFLCDDCGYETAKWLGHCPRCDAWNSFKEVTPETGTKKNGTVAVELVYDLEGSEERVVSGIDELDRVLGGGVVAGSSILLGGDPGVGKSTLCFEVAARFVRQGLEVLYISGEESARQLVSRRKRLGCAEAFPFLVTSRLDVILQAINEKRYDFLVIDSIQSTHNPELPMLPGSMAQIRDVSSRLIQVLKEKETAHVFIGHVTKEGAIAGPKILEHLVDTVLYFEGDKMLPYRMVRAMKNRFGPVDEVGIFQMTAGGLQSIANPSEFFMSERGELGSGSILFPYMTGTRPLLIEVQSVATKTNFSNPRRLAVGYDLNRLFILLAVLEKVLSTSFFDRDVYVNVTGGLKVGEPAADLAVAGAILSSVKERSAGRETAFFGEIGLTGEVRKTVNMDQRIRECQRFGIRRVLCPPGLEPTNGMDVISLKNIRDLPGHL